nr:hypothetical protein BSM_00990 [uncultured archaeon]
MFCFNSNHELRYFQFQGCISEPEFGYTKIGLLTNSRNALKQYHLEGINLEINGEHLT